VIAAQAGVPDAAPAIAAQLQAAVQATDDSSAKGLVTSGALAASTSAS